MATRKAVRGHVGVFQRAHSTRRHDGRPDVCYDVKFTVGGKPKWVKVGWRSEGYTAAYASKRRNELIHEARHGVQRDPRLTMDQAYELWQTRHADANLKRPDIPASHWSTLVRPHLGGKRLDQITPLDLEDMKKALADRGLSPQTIRHGLDLVRAVYRKAAAWGLYSGPFPTSEVARPRVDNARMRWLAAGEAKALLAELLRRSQRTYLMALASLHTGARFGEVAALRGENVRFAGCLLELQDTKHGSRAVPMTPTLAYELTALDVRPGRLVFPSRTGGISPEPSDAYARAVEKLGLNQGIEDRRDRVVFHTLRHTFGSWLAQRGTPLYTISRLMGHNVEETTRRYAKLSPDVQAAAVQGIESMLHG